MASSTVNAGRRPAEVRPPASEGMTPRSLVAFFALAFGLGWGLVAVLILFRNQVEAIFGEIGYTNPMFILAVYSPAIAGIALVWRHYGIRAVGSFLRRVTLWRMPAAWWVLLVLGIPAVKYIGAAINGTIGDFPFAPWYGVFPAFGVALLIGPIEEFGWRGVALPLLQRRWAPLWASLILGGFWGLWHLPAFLLSGTPQSAWSFGPYAIGVLTLSVMLTPMFNAARGSLLIAALFHFQMNGPAWPDAQPWENYLFALVAVVIVLLNRTAMLTHAHAVTDVVADGDDTNRTDPARFAQEA
jgi:membrane protease YdiL (CAAX protease family)